MDLKIFAGQDKSELSMIEVAHAILAERGKTLAFADLVNEIQNYLSKSDEEIRQRLAQFYTDLNFDGRFISLGENVWGLREWYPYDSVDEEVNHPEDEDEHVGRKRRRKVNAFLDDMSEDDDIIDYNDDDPEDDDLEADSNDQDTEYSNFEADDDQDDAIADDGLADGIEGQLSEFSDDDDDDDTQFGHDDLSEDK